MKTFNVVVKELRKSANLTQKQLAETIGIKERMYQHYEAGTHMPEFPIIIKLADYFNVSLDYLVGRSDDPTRR
jgi:transcriptional regulator with XRE-family HTH domain